MSTAGTNRQTAIGRWAGLGPYYAMFPIDFAFNVIEQYSSLGDAVLDPFAGRASSVYAAAALGRSSCGIEINPVGWLYGRVKLKPATKPSVLRRIREIGEIAKAVSKEVIEELPEFFSFCYSSEVLRYLIAARNTLCWKTSIVDGTLMAIILVNLHGKRQSSLSNQMRQGKAMSPDYSVRWWKSHNLLPPEIDPITFLMKKVDWRYGKGTPYPLNGNVIFGDSMTSINRIHKNVIKGKQKPFDLLFTSPPYHSITNYHKDQWLRLWMMGGYNHPTLLKGKWQKRFDSKSEYRDLLQTVFKNCAKVMSPDAVIYIRTDVREFTYQTTLDALTCAFPHKEVTTLVQPFTKMTQTALFGDKTQKPGEIDIILR